MVPCTRIPFSPRRARIYWCRLRAARFAMSRLSHVFLFDSDAKGRDTLVYGLEGDAVSVRAPTSCDEARAVLRTTPRPEVIVVVLREGEREAPALLRSLSETASLAAIPR